RSGRRVSPLADVLRPDPAALAAAFVVDLAIGDPVYRAHPIRLIGASLGWLERQLRALGFDGYGGGIALFVLLALFWMPVLVGPMALAHRASPVAGWIVHVAVLYTMLALGDLLHHVWRIEAAVRSADIDRARHAVSALV